MTGSLRVIISNNSFPLTGGAIELKVTKFREGFQHKLADWSPAVGGSQFSSKKVVFDSGKVKRGWELEGEIFPAGLPGETEALVYSRALTELQKLQQGPKRWHMSSVGQTYIDYGNGQFPVSFDQFEWVYEAGAPAKFKWKARFTNARKFTI